MPFKSAAQRKYLYAKHPEVARRFAAEEASGNYKKKEAVKRAVKGKGKRS